jgi:hypothetical protein
MVSETLARETIFLAQTPQAFRPEVLRRALALGVSATDEAALAERAGGFAITDGPFGESKEVLGGYYVIEAADLDEALAIAKEVPAPFGGVEVRPIRVLS